MRRVGKLASLVSRPAALNGGQLKAAFEHALDGQVFPTQGGAIEAEADRKKLRIRSGFEQLVPVGWEAKNPPRSIPG
jgi:hypothetical protein